MNLVISIYSYIYKNKLFLSYQQLILFLKLLFFYYISVCIKMYFKYRINKLRKNLDEIYNTSVDYKNFVDIYFNLKNKLKERLLEDNNLKSNVEKFSNENKNIDLIIYGGGTSGLFYYLGVRMCIKELGINIIKNGGQSAGGWASALFDVSGNNDKLFKYNLLHFLKCVFGFMLLINKNGYFLTYKVIKESMRESLQSFFTINKTNNLSIFVFDLLKLRIKEIELNKTSSNDLCCLSLMATSNIPFYNAGLYTKIKESFYIDCCNFKVSFQEKKRKCLILKKRKKQKKDTILKGLTYCSFKEAVNQFENGIDDFLKFIQCPTSVDNIYFE